MPEAASTPPVRGSIATTPPRRLPSACTAAVCTAVEIVVRTGARLDGDGRGDRAPAGPQLAAGAAEEPHVEDPFEAADADDRVGRDPERLEVGLAVGRDRAERAGDRGRDRAERGGAGLAAGEGGLVAREERPAGRQPGLPRELLAAAQPGEDEVVRTSRSRRR